VDWIQDTRDPKALAVLEGMVKQTQYISRIESIRALGLLKSRKSWDLVVDALINDDENMRHVAAQSLAMMAEKGDEKKFHTYLLKERKSNKVRLALLEGVRNINSSDTLKTARYWLTDKDPAIRTLCIDIMDKFGKDREFKLLSRKLNDSDIDVRLKVWVIFMKRKDPKIIKQFKQARYWMTIKHVHQLVENPKLKLHQEMLDKLLLSLALDGFPEMRDAILNLFIKRGPATLALVEKVLDESVESEAAGRAYTIYTQFQKEKGMDMYIKQMKSRFAPVRAVTFQALRQYASPDLLEQVKTAMTNERSDYPRAEAARAFVQISLRKAAQ
jgi:HEAT repeat protein